MSEYEKRPHDRRSFLRVAARGAALLVLGEASWGRSLLLSPGTNPETESTTCPTTLSRTWSFSHPWTASETRSGSFTSNITRSGTATLVPDGKYYGTCTEALTDSGETVTCSWTQIFELQPTGLSVLQSYSGHTVYYTRTFGPLVKYTTNSSGTKSYTSSYECDADDKGPVGGGFAFGDSGEPEDFGIGCVDLGQDPRDIRTRDGVLYRVEI